jgi:hypothetical protein
MDRTQYELLAVLAVATWSYCAGRYTGTRNGARNVMQGFIQAATSAGLLNELDSLIRAVYTSYTQPTKGTR